TEVDVDFVRYVAVFPAPAGINRQFVVRDPVRACVPRASGDKPRLWNLWRSLVLCSPRQRG
ncbi:hypothetical protein ACSOOE_004356, partial [Escherichia coli]